MIMIKMTTQMMVMMIMIRTIRIMILMIRIITRSSSLPTVEDGRGSQGMWDAWKKVQC